MDRLRRSPYRPAAPDRPHLRGLTQDRTRSPAQTRRSPLHPGRQPHKSLPVDLDRRPLPRLNRKAASRSSADTSSVVFVRSTAATQGSVPTVFGTASGSRTSERTNRSGLCDSPPSVIFCARSFVCPAMARTQPILERIPTISSLDSAITTGLIPKRSSTVCKQSSRLASMSALTIRSAFSSLI